MWGGGGGRGGTASIISTEVFQRKSLIVIHVFLSFSFSVVFKLFYCFQSLFLL